MMTEKIVTVFKELIALNNPRKNLNHLISLLLFAEFIIIGTNKIFPLYDAFISFYPSGLPKDVTCIIEVVFYISFFLSAVYTLIFWILFVADSFVDMCINKYTNSTYTPQILYSAKSKFHEISYGCQENLFITINILLIIVMPLSILNESVLINCATAHPGLCILVGMMTIFIIPTICSNIVSRFFSC